MKQVYTHKEIYCKKLLHVIMEAENSQDLEDESARWRLRGAKTSVPV